MLDAHADFYAGMSASLEKKEAKGWFEAEKRTWRVSQQKMKELKARPSAYFQPKMTRGGLYKMAPTAVERFLKSGMVKFEDNFLAQLVSTKRGHLFTLASRYKDNPDAKAMIEKIIERVTSILVQWMIALLDQAVHLRRPFASRADGLPLSSKWQCRSMTAICT